jgi:hypothetical protein
MLNVETKMLKVFKNVESGDKNIENTVRNFKLQIGIFNSNISVEIF